jgi:hypothetical protein
MLKWMMFVAGDDARYSRVALALGAAILPSLAGVMADTLRV